ncbi:MAG TPA: glycosyltransferase family 39 protein [Candidatus Limnocylindrales bacterium]|nr:glycosyltransferase family 39 protein [Candidatus Limnocylindrales bacterium]
MLLNRWVRPALLAVAATAAVLYAWRLGANGLHPYYAPAVKSMSVSWKAFLYGGYDPAASITLDKLPGAFMVQALSARIFGFHTWSLLLPQVLASVLTIFILYRVVRRWQGPVPGLIAATFYALTPVVAALARAQVSDTILVLLLVLAADAWQRAVTTARTGPLLWCGVWVGLAFQTKMVQAWGVLPAFALVYLLAAPTNWRRRLGQLGLAGLVTATVSLWWIVLVALTPEAARPYIDGSRDHSVWSMVFGYNLFDRYGTDERPVEPVWWYLLGDGTAPQVGWLYPIALAGLVFGVWWRGKAPRTDPVRAGFLMWGLWLLVHAVALSTGRVAHVFYVIAIAPPVAALSAGGLATLWAAYRTRASEGPSWPRWMLPAATAATSAWAVYLSLRFPDFLPWMPPAIAAAGTVATIGLLIAAVIGPRPMAPDRPVTFGLAAGRLAIAGAVAGIVAILLAPATWTMSTVDQRYAGTAIGPAAGVGGDFAANEAAAQAAGAIPPGVVAPAGAPLPGVGLPPGVGPPPARLRTGPLGPVGPGGAAPGAAAGMSDRPSPRARLLLDYLVSQHRGQKYLVAVQAADTAGDLLMSGRSVLPMGGFGGRAPFPTNDQLAAMVADGRLRFVLLALARPDPAGWSTWSAGHCRTVDPARYGGQQRAEFLFDCAG